MKAELGAFGVAALVGVGVVLALPSPPPPPHAPAVVPAGQPRTVRARAACPDETPVLEDLAELQQQVDAARAALAVASAQEELATGAPLAWPADAPADHQQAAVEPALAAIAEAHGGTLVGVDCGEYPCVGVFAWTGFDTDLAQDARAALRQTWPGTMHGAHGLFRPDDRPVEGQWVAFALPMDGLDETEQERVRFRMDEVPGIFDPRDVIDPDGPR